MPTLQQIEAWRGRTAVDADGDKIGTIEDVYLDRKSGEPEWIAVKTGLFGTRVSFAPIRDAQEAGDDVRVAYDKDKIKDAPNIDADGELSPEEERSLYEYYGRGDYSDWTDTSEDRTVGVLGDDRDDEARVGTRAATPAAATGGAGGELREGDDARADVDDRGTAPGRAGTAAGDVDVADRDTDDAMTRSDEELHVGTEARQRGRARLRKYVTTEEETRTVPVQREEARVEREPITDDNIEQAMSGPEISEADHEVTLYEEEPVVEKRVEPKERIRLEKDAHTDEHEVSEEVRKEHIEPEGDATDNR
jgi:uncharacterized protein (TIGR02271 family)